MTVLESASLRNALNALQAILYIEYRAPSQSEGADEQSYDARLDVQEIINEAIHRLENNYSCRLDHGVYQEMAENALVSTNLEIFLSDLNKCLKDIAMLVSLSVYTKQPPINLSDVSFLGVGWPPLKNTLRALTSKQHYDRGCASIPALINNLNSIEMCDIKQLFIAMLVMAQLKIPEGVAICAQLLLLGGSWL